MSTQLATHVSHIVFALRWLLLVTLGWMFKRGGGSGGGGGGGVSWANDLAGSSNTHQWLASISGTGGGGGSVPVANATTIGFVVTGASLATSSRINFSQDDLSLLSIRSHGDTTDVAIIRSTGPSEATVFGDNTTNIQDSHLIGDSVQIYGRGQVNEIILGISAAAGIQIFSGSSEISITNESASVTGMPWTFDTTSPIVENAYVQFTPATSPASPAAAVLIGKADSTGIGDGVRQSSDQNMLCTLAPAGDGARPFIDIMEKTLTGVAAGGSAAVTFPVPASACVFAEVTAVGVTATGAAGCKLSATATVRNSVGTAAFVAAVAGSSNPKLNPYGDDAADVAYAAVVPSTLTLTVSLNTLRVQFNNNGAAANDVAILCKFKLGFHA